MENKLPSKSKVEEIMDRWDRENPMFFSVPRDPEDETQDDKDRETFRQVLRAYVDGKLIEPLSREELTDLAMGIYREWEDGFFPINTMIDALLRQVGKVQEDISNSMLRRFRVQHGLDIVTGKPPVELTEEDILAILWKNHNLFAATRINWLRQNLRELAQEIVKAMKGVK